MMLLKVSLLVVGILAGAAWSASVDCNTDQTCAKPWKFYEELGCKAVLGARSCCAKRYECPDFKKLDDNKCTFEGKEYKIGEILPRINNDNTKCVETCFCTRQDNEPAKFACSNSDCGVSSFKVPGCINLYGDLNECCSTSIVCDEAEKQSLASCFVEKEYREGEKFVPASNPCYECLCHKDFDNTTIADNPHCRKLNCQIDLRYKSFVQRGCLPVFHSEQCCPVDWECPKHSKKIIKRAADDAESQTVKPEVFIVTPSKNQVEYLTESQRANDDDSLTSSTDIPITTYKVPLLFTDKVEKSVTDAPSTNAPLVEADASASTVPPTIPTLSTNPFEVPSDGVTVTVSIKHEEDTTASLKALIEPEASTEQITTNEPTIITTSPIPSTEKAQETTQASTDVETVSTSATHKSTTEKIESKESDESSEESDESEETTKNIKRNLPVKDAEKEAEVKETKIPNTTETVSSDTTETPREIVKTLEQPEELTTVQPLSTSEIPAIPVAPLGLPDLSTELTLLSREVLTESPPTELTTNEETSPKASSEVSSTEASSTEAEKTTQSTTQSAPTTPTYLDKFVFPTEYDKLLTTLKEFVEKVESLTSTEVPNTSPVQVNPQLEQQVEFVNFTVSSEKQNEETKSIAKRSLSDVDSKPFFSSIKEKGCIFNGKSFKVGEAIKTDNECLKCMCEYAPFGHCVLKEKCNV